MNESQWAREYTTLLKTGGAMVMAIVPEGMQEPGWPDRWVCHRQWCGWLENKKGSNKLSDLQARRLRDLRARGQAAFTLRWIDELIRFECDDIVVYVVAYDTMMRSWKDFLFHCQAATMAAEGHVWQRPNNN